MTEHLPECLQIVGKRSGPCVCWLLHECEQRVWDEAYAAGFNAGRAHGESRACSLSYQHGLDAAREAVEQVSSLFHPLGPALAAIDALKEKTDE